MQNKQAKRAPNVNTKMNVTTKMTKDRIDRVDTHRYKMRAEKKSKILAQARARPIPPLQPKAQPVIQGKKTGRSSEPASYVKCRKVNGKLECK
jgi:hypothetical protein